MLHVKLSDEVPIIGWPQSPASG